MGENNEILEYKNFYLFYQNLYARLFNVINLLIDEKEYNITNLKNTIIDFLDWYSYYLFKQKLITKDDKERTALNLLEEIKKFESFFDSLNTYPTTDYIKYRTEYLKKGNDLNALSEIQQSYIIKEYYYFLEEVLQIIKKFIDISSECGFLPNIKSKTALKSIGYSNYDAFFINLENLKIKTSEITNNINLTNAFISRRSIYCLIVCFSPYFKNREVLEKLEKELSFKFLENEDIFNKIIKVNKYKSVYDIPRDLQLELDKELIKPLKTNISYIKRYISFEFGERDMSPTIKKKYAYDPTGV